MIRSALFPAALLGLLLLSAPAAWAQSCCAEDATSPEDQAKFEAIFKQGEPALNQLMEQIWNKQGEMRGLMTGQKPDTTRIEALNKEIGDLRAKLAAERAALRQKLADAGFQMGRGTGPGYGRGYGPCAMAQPAAAQAGQPGQADPAGQNCCAPAPGQDAPGGAKPTPGK